ncbi:hypothetical protein Hamer_G018526 [Homarus americanus]|uniref:Ig-like domain-containing protein n=1 Tax=Homarus americanus TaxID=6706 RepID=A0A8J5JKJ5_HOMAM|nr:hypothetical protein Hamer_G018526 [Homarus americanus]
MGVATDGVKATEEGWWEEGSAPQPQFENTPSNVTARVGDSAFLPCTVSNLGDRSVLHADDSNEWTLQIKFATIRDSGIYECHVNSDPKISRQVALLVRVPQSDLTVPQLDLTVPQPDLTVPQSDLTVPQSDLTVPQSDLTVPQLDLTVPQPCLTVSQPCLTVPQPGLIEPLLSPFTEHSQLDDPAFMGITTTTTHPTPVVLIEGPAERHIQAGSVLTLTCLIHHPPRQAPAHYHSAPPSPPCVSPQTEKFPRKTRSQVMLSNVRDSDSGEYSCSPSDLPPTVITVHVQHGQHQAAVQQGGLSAAPVANPVTHLLLLLLLMMLQRVKTWQ